MPQPPLLGRTVLCYPTQKSIEQRLPRVAVIVADCGDGIIRVQAFHDESRAMSSSLTCFTLEYSEVPKLHHWMWPPRTSLLGHTPITAQLVNDAYEAFCESTGPMLDTLEAQMRSAQNGNKCRCEKLTFEQLPSVMFLRDQIADRKLWDNPPKEVTITDLALLKGKIQAITNLFRQELDRHTVLEAEAEEFAEIMCDLLTQLEQAIR